MRKPDFNAYELLASPRTPANKKKKKQRRQTTDAAATDTYFSEKESVPEGLLSGRSRSTGLSSTSIEPLITDGISQQASSHTVPSRSLRYSVSVSHSLGLQSTHQVEALPSTNAAPHNSLTHTHSIIAESETQLETQESLSKDFDMRDSKASGMAIGGWEMETFRDYLTAEIMPPQTYPTADVVWGQTERDKVYNFLINVPYQLERVMWFGSLVCLDSFLAYVTLLPLRCLNMLRPRSHGSNPSVRKIRGDQVYDMLCVAIILWATVCIWHVSPGVIYYWLKDITSEFLKITVLYSALELFDKILSNFGVDAMDALAGTCTLWVQADPVHGQLRKVVQDSIILFGVTFLHAVIIMCQAMVYSVVMTGSKKYALLALLIAGNFVEIKGTVYKRMDTTKMWAVLCLDILELYHLLIALLFVMVEDMDSSGSWLPSRGTLWSCIQVLLSEVVIDIIKHAVLGKFNDIRPGVYREYMRDFCERVGGSQSHNSHKLVGFFPLGPVVLLMRTAVTICMMHRHGTVSPLPRAALAWLALLLLKPFLGYGLKLFAYKYVKYYFQRHGKAVKLHLDSKKSKEVRRLKKD